MAVRVAVKERTCKPHHHLFNKTTITKKKTRVCVLHERGNSTVVALGLQKVKKKKRGD